MRTASLIQSPCCDTLCPGEDPKRTRYLDAFLLAYNPEVDYCSRISAAILVHLSSCWTCRVAFKRGVHHGAVVQGRIPRPVSVSLLPSSPSSPSSPPPAPCRRSPLASRGHEGEPNTRLPSTTQCRPPPPVSALRDRSNFRPMGARDRVYCCC